MIELNKHPAGRRSNMIFGLCSIIDGAIRVTTLGFCHGLFCLTYSRYQSKSFFAKAKAKREACQ